MTAASFMEWDAKQPEGRYELDAGKVIQIPTESAGHNRAKGRVASALHDAVKKSCPGCMVFTSGMALIINDRCVRNPDASVDCGEYDPEGTSLAMPVVVVEVEELRPTPNDAGSKLIEYFSVPSIQHYLIVLVEAEAIIHHQRAANGEFLTHIVRSGEIVLNPPGIRFDVGSILAA